LETKIKSVSIQEYARTHKLSIYTVVQQSKRGLLKSETKKINGKDEIFIFAEQIAPEPISEGDKIEDYEKAYFKLKLQYTQLKTKYDKLLKKI